MEGSYRTAIADVKRKRIPHSRGSWRKTARAKNMYGHEAQTTDRVVVGVSVRVGVRVHVVV